MFRTLRTAPKMLILRSKEEPFSHLPVLANKVGSAGTKPGMSSLRLQSVVAIANLQRKPIAYDINSMLQVPTPSHPTMQRFCSSKDSSCLPGLFLQFCSSGAQTQTKRRLLCLCSRFYLWVFTNIQYNREHGLSAQDVGGGGWRSFWVVRDFLIASLHAIHSLRFPYLPAYLTLCGGLGEEKRSECMPCGKLDSW